ncbi:LacI family DNA-binding transcriptional regulator [Paraburkholderia dipogonis]|uniref:LacI family DNA-binding transcriptional regulator n=1 Tax=Paraburkholderia dipogonis TaxID=1211383 RepID=UPI00141BCA61|nr:LacI family DNA-binding transcriptional regulator [Paraburkholderia dipogonis]
MKEVAEAAGVSMMSVSNVLHNRPNVGEVLRERVLKQVKELGYVPNRSAQELAGVSYVRFGLLYTNVRNPFIASVFAGSLTAASRLRADISIHLANIDNPAALRKTIRQMADSGIEGLLLPSPVAEAAAQAFKRKPLPIPAVAIAPGFPVPGMASLRCDEQQAAFEVVSALLDLGHTAIGHLAGPTSQSGCIARHNGYLAALRARSIEPRPEYVVKSEFKFQEGVQAADVLLELEPRVTAIFAANDTLAASVMAAAHRRSIAVPGTLSVVGYDDSPTAEYVWPGLTTVHQDFEALTERAVNVLHKNVIAWRNDQSFRSDQDVVLPYEIVRRPSIGKAPKAVIERRTSSTLRSAT